MIYAGKVSTLRHEKGTFAHGDHVIDADHQRDPVLRALSG
jgi:hypothetical protein